MATRDSFGLAPPQYVFDTYKSIRNSNLISNKSLYDGSIEEFRDLLNKAQPRSEEDVQIRSLIQYLYRRNPNNFCRYLIKSRLSHLILWTESKCIVRHFGLRGIVYVKWDNNSYECSLHRHVKTDADEETTKQMLSSIGCDEFEDRRNQPRQYGDVGGRQQYNRADQQHNEFKDRRNQPMQYSRRQHDRRQYQYNKEPARTMDSSSKGRGKNYSSNTVNSIKELTNMLQQSKNVESQTNDFPPLPGPLSTKDFPALSVTVVHEEPPPEVKDVSSL